MLEVEMWRGAIAAVFLWGVSNAGNAQQANVDPALITAIEQVCKPFVLDGVAATDIAALSGFTAGGSRYELSADIAVGFSDYGRVRVCRVTIGSEDVAAYRAAIMAAAERWPLTLEYRGDIPPGPGFVRHERFCPGQAASPVSWSLLSRDSGTRLTLGIVSAAGSHCSGPD